MSPRLLLVLALPLAACAAGPTVTRIPLGAPAPRPPRPPATVAIFLGDPPAASRVVYVLETTAFRDADRLIALRDAAAELGCDGLVLRDVELERDPSPHHAPYRTVPITELRRPGYASGLCVVREPGPPGGP